MFSQPRDTRVRARDRHMYGNNQAVERAARRLWEGLGNCAQFCIFLSGGRETPTQRVSVYYHQ